MTGLQSTFVHFRGNNEYRYVLEVRYIMQKKSNWNGIDVDVFVLFIVHMRKKNKKVWPF